MSPDSSVLEIFRVRFPFDDPEANGVLWKEIDELHFPVDVRRRLAANGFRVGLVGGQIPPPVLARLLELEDKPVRTDDTEIMNLAEFEATPRVERRHMPLRNGQRGEIILSPVYEELPVLLRRNGHLAGESYRKAQGRLAVTTQALPDGRVRIRIVPELLHGDMRQKWVGNRGAFMHESSQASVVFEELGLAAVLSPGEMIVLTSLPQRPGSLGHHFFTEDDGTLAQKLLVIRLCQTQHDDTAPMPKILPLDE